MFVRVEFRGTGVGKALGFLSTGYTLWGTHIAPYSPVSQPVSGLGLGPTAPFMNAAFVLSGIPLLLGVAGIFQGISEMNPRARWICLEGRRVGQSHPYAAGEQMNLGWAIPSPDGTKLAIWKAQIA